MFAATDAMERVKYDDRTSYRKDYVNRNNWTYGQDIADLKKAGPDIKFDESSTYRNQYFDKMQTMRKAAVDSNGYWRELNDRPARGVLPHTSGKPYTEKRYACPTPDWLKQLKSEMESE